MISCGGGQHGQNMLTSFGGGQPSKDYLTIPQILKLNGLEYHTLEPADADIIGKRLLEDNKKAYPHDFPPRIHEIALLTKYWYVHSQGLKKTARMFKARSLRRAAAALRQS